MKTGIETLIKNREYITQAIGLVTNHTGRLSSGQLTVDALIKGGYKLKALFSPEHGLYGVEREGVRTDNQSYHGIPVFSLYGENRRPSEEQLKGMELILFDMQDIGVRYYTYLYSLAYVMEEAARYSLPVIVTDRPAPLGRKVEGNPLEPECHSFVGAYGLPNRTGLTIGEYALYLKDNFIPHVDLTVIPMEGYTPGWWPAKYPWINPSPNIPSLQTALLYGGTCLIEGTSLSEGRGTTRPFELVGAPAIDERLLADCLNDLSLESVKFYPVQFKPVLSKFKGEICRGVQIHVTQRDSFNSLKTGLALLSTLFRFFPESVSFHSSLQEKSGSFIELLSGSSYLPSMLLDRTDYREIYQCLSGKEETFIKFRDRVALYPSRGVESL